MIRLTFAAFFFVTACCAHVPEKKSWEEYLSFLEGSSSGSFLEGEIEILKDLEEIQRAMKQTDRDVGIVYQDKYWIWINDPVRFPSGALGVYGRIVSRASLLGAVGAAVLPVLKDGRVALNCNFRHATRSWELEIPRGFSEKGETIEETARRELKEETGLIARELIFLGEIAPDSGTSSSIVPVFLAKIEEVGQACAEESEAIASILFLTPHQLKEILVQGSIILKKEGQEKRIFLRDPFLTYALLRMELLSFGD